MKDERMCYKNFMETKALGLPTTSKQIYVSETLETSILITHLSKVWMKFEENYQTILI